MTQPDIRLQLAKLIIGALGGLALLAFFLVGLHLGVTFGEVERVGIIATAAASFGLALHGAWKSPPAPPAPPAGGVP